MNKCRLCQQINNNLTKVYSNRIKSLAQIILKLKGFKEPLNVEKSLKICENCKQGIENVSTFWEKIPEAKPLLEELHEKQEVLSNPEPFPFSKQSLPAIQYDYEASAEVKREPIKIRIKRPCKLKRQDKPVNTTILTTESFPKRIRRCPKRYEDFDVPTTAKAIASETESNKCSITCLTNSPLVALLRLNDGQDIGELFEVDSEGKSSRIRIICRTCSQVFRFERVFQKHFKAHNKYQFEESVDIIKNYLYYCKLCDKSFPRHHAVRRHYSNVHSEERPLKCQYCEASFKHKFNLDYHLAKHVPKQHFECVFCKKMFLKRYELQIHLRTHTKERPYKCEICSFASAHRSNLKTHLKTKHLISSTNIVENTAPDEKFMPPLALLEDKAEIQPDLNNEKVQDASFIPTLAEHFTSGLANENNFSETKNNWEHSDVPDSKLTSNNDSKILEVSEENEAWKENLISQAKLGTFKLDCSILKSLTSSTLLGLKKWPKSFQSIPSSSELEQTTEFTYINNQNSNIIEHPANTKHSTDAIKSIIKYTPLQNNSSGNSTQIANYKTMYQISNPPQAAANCNSLISNIKTKNVEVSSRSLLKKCDELINISKLTQTSLTKRHKGNLNDVVQAEIVGNELKTTETASDMKCENVLPQADDSQSWKVIKISAKPVKIKNILNLKTTTNSTTSKNNASYESHTTTKMCNETLTANSLQFLKTNIHQIEKTNYLTNTPAPNNGSKPLSKYNNISQQSVQKPNLKTQQISNLSIPSCNENPTILARKPLITNIEILPPLTLDILQKVTLTTAPTNLIKPPTDYKHQCPYCYKYFKQRSALTKHIRTHTGEKPYKCNLCPKSYADASNYNKHKLLHKHAAEALNISGTASYAVQHSPAYSTVSDPDPDGIEIMQTLKIFECSSTEEDEDIDDTSTTSSTMESEMWQNALEHVLNNDEIRENLKRNFVGINNAILPKLHAVSKIDLNKSCSTEDPYKG